jgi:hypothetical protein
MAAFSVVGPPITRVFGLTLLMMLCGNAQSSVAADYLLDGFRIGWRDHPHRLRELGFELQADGTARTELRGGPWSDGRRLQDEGRIRVWSSAINHPGVHTIDGSTGWMVASGRLRTGLARPAVARSRVSCEIAEAPFGVCDQWAVLLRGFEIDTDCTHPDGFVTKGFGFCLGSPTVLAGTDASTRQVSFDATLRVQAGRLPLRMRPEQYTVRARMHYTLVGLESGHVTRAANSLVIRTPGGKDRPLHSAARRIVVQGQPGFGWAVVGLTGFDFHFNPNKNRFGGRYVRDLWVHNRDFSYEPGTGRMTLISDVGFSNRSLWAYATTTISETHVVLLQAGK